MRAKRKAPQHRTQRMGGWWQVAALRPDALIQKFGEAPPNGKTCHLVFRGTRLGVTDHGWQRFVERWSHWLVRSGEKMPANADQAWCSMVEVFGRSELVPNGHLRGYERKRQKVVRERFTAGRYFRDPVSKLLFVTPLYEDSIVTVLPRDDARENEISQNKVRSA